MRNARVPLYKNPMKSVTVNPAATVGAQVGVNFVGPDGKLVTSAMWKAMQGGTGGADITTTDDLDEGQYRLYFTDARAQDAVSTILDDATTGDIAFNYDPHTLIAGHAVRMTFEATAGEDVSSNRVVCIKSGKAYYPDIADASDVGAIVGVAYTSAASGETFRVMTSGHLKEGAWSWSTGRIYCASNGQLTQTVPVTGAVCEVGRAVDSHTIEVGIRPAILRA